MNSDFSNGQVKPTMNSSFVSESRTGSRGMAKVNDWVSFLNLGTKLNWNQSVSVGPRIQLGNIHCWERLSRSSVASYYLAELLLTALGLHWVLKKLFPYSEDTREEWCDIIEHSFPQVGISVAGSIACKHQKRSYYCEQHKRIRTVIMGDQWTI